MPPKVKFQRYLCSIDTDPHIDESGLLSGWYLEHARHQFLDAQQAAQQDAGGLVIAEAGMGKTVFMEHLEQSAREVGREVVRLELGKYAAAVSRFEEDLERQGADTVILDGLDEAPKLLGPLLRRVPKLDATCVWIASRDGDGVHAVKEAEKFKRPCYRLVPLSREDLVGAAEQIKVDPQAFLAAAEHAGLLPLCTKPIGARFALESFAENGLVGASQRELWESGIEKLCDEIRSPARVAANQRQWLLSGIVETAAWIALCLALTGRRFVWQGQESECPPDSLGLSELSQGKDDPELTRSALARGVFRPLGDGRVAPDHQLYGDYLAARGFDQFIAAVHWPSLLYTASRAAVLASRAGIAGWLAAFSPKFLQELCDLQPELLLATVDTVQAVVADVLCKALLDRARSLSYDQRSSLRHLERLKGDRTCEVLKDSLSAPDLTTEVLEFAADVAEACGYAELSDWFVSRALDKELPLRQRERAAYAARTLGNGVATARLKELLPIAPGEDPFDTMRGLVLSACWPAHLTGDELVPELVEPKENVPDRYSVFLERDLPRSVDASMDSTRVATVLSWAIDHLRRPTHEAFGSAARQVYTACWRLREKHGLTESLARGYLAAMDDGCPFQWDSSFGEIAPLSQEEFRQDSDGRFAVLEQLLRIAGGTPERQLRNPWPGYELFGPGDIPWLCDRVVADPADKLTPRWARCFLCAVPREGIDTFGTHIDKLHALLPDQVPDRDAIRRNWQDEDRRQNDQAASLKARRQAEEAEAEREQAKIEHGIAEALDRPDLSPRFFPEIALWLCAKNGQRRFGPVDLTTSPGWKPLTAAQQSALLGLAERYLAEDCVKPTLPGELQFYEAQALTLLRVRRPDAYERLDEGVWRRCGVELLKAAIPVNGVDRGPLLDTLSGFRDAARSCLREVLRQEIGRGLSSVLRTWGKDRLTAEQAADAVADVFGPDVTPLCQYNALRELADLGQEEIVHSRLESALKGPWGPTGTATPLLICLALELKPAEYVSRLLEAIERDPGWGREWFEAALQQGGEWLRLRDALVTAEPLEIGRLYAWLRDKHPPTSRPQQGQITIRTWVDSAYDLQDHLLAHLHRSGREGCTIALETVLARFPDDSWLNDWIADARAAEDANGAPLLTVEEIAQLGKERVGLVNSAADLLDWVCQTLEAYQRHLQGDIPAVADLWNTKPKNEPHDEAHFSDHLTRYLDNHLGQGVVVNREVQIRQKLCADGQAGSRTDIWIQATHPDRPDLTLCLEVKCSWNHSAQTALADQLIAKYMSGGTATSGILLLGWFHCDLWKHDKGPVWPDKDTAKSELDQQAETKRQDGNLVRAVVVDCTLR